MTVLDCSLRLGNLLRKTEEGTRLLEIKSSIEEKYKGNSAYNQYEQFAEKKTSEYYFFAWDVSHQSFMNVLQDNNLVYKEVPEKVDAYPDASMWGNLPATAFYVRHVDGVSFNMVRFEVDGEDNRPAMIFDDTRDVVVNGLILNDKHVGTSAVKITNTKGAMFSNCDVKDGVRFLYELSGDQNQDIRVNEMDLPDVIKAFDAKTGNDGFAMSDFINEKEL